ncbi:MAG TPA: 5'-deoxynucleotidase [Candidatus Stercoripulliclostridium merdigallinarum]|uniref:5'-deoxynucleotidase n=1 Tax=Candidatus Stercoripulliclostridium merdigallinarum TaxID=2840951 RepID=A0A9D1MH55_9FIRM|nr:5'-deoxynucleotidase [Candidatus Stercoripulliclostridium merdigallinarum]
MKNYNFFAYLSRMKYIKRWSLMHSTVKENVMEHSAEVAQIAHALGMINKFVFGGSANPDKLAALAIFHEAAEVITGDLPTPIKYYNEDIRSAYKSIEAIAERQLVNMLPTEFADAYTEYVTPDTASLEGKLLKAADKLAAYVKCLEELKYGNKEFLKAKNATLKALKDMALPEVDYFFENFIRGYELTLDELD